MDLIDDIYLETRAERRQPRRVDHRAHVIDARMARGVHLYHVDVAPFCDRNARVAHAARVNRRTALPIRANAIERLGDQPGCTGLADSAYAGQ